MRAIPLLLIMSGLLVYVLIRFRRGEKIGKNSILTGLFLITCPIVIIAVLEIFCGYYTFFVEHRGESALKGNIKRKFIDRMPLKAKRVSVEKNPFIDYDLTLGCKFHPFITFSGVETYSEPGYKLDYFGFRNNEDIYFQKKDYILVVLTGGSEAAGFSHRFTITENLERILNNEGGGRKFKVLNLAMNGYAIANEIGTYVYLCYHLKPEFVITHTGYNDVRYALAVPCNFKKLGLNYMSNLELWPPRLYDLKEGPKQPEYIYNEKGCEFIVDAFLHNLEKYKKIVEGNGGRLIVGLQGYNKRISDPFDIKRASLYEDIITKGRDRIDVDFSKIGGIGYSDIVHTTTSIVIARVYADKILDELNIQRLPMVNQKAVRIE